MSIEKPTGYSKAEVDLKYALFKAEVDAQVLQFKIFALEDKILDSTIQPIGQKDLTAYVFDWISDGNFQACIRNKARELFHLPNKHMDAKIAILTPNQKSLLLAETLRISLPGYEYLIPYFIAKLGRWDNYGSDSLKAIFELQSDIKPEDFAIFHQFLSIFAPAYLGTPELIRISKASIPKKLGLRFSHMMSKGLLQSQIADFNQAFPQQLLRLK